MDVVFADLDPRFAALNVYLGELKRGRRMAAVADLDPRGFGPWLPFLNLIDVVLAGDAVRFRFRLVGAAQSAAAQLQYQGRFVDDAVAPASRRRVIDDLTRVAATCRPKYGRYGMPFPGRGFVESERAVQWGESFFGDQSARAGRARRVRDPVDPGASGV